MGHFMYNTNNLIDGVVWLKVEYNCKQSTYTIITLLQIEYITQKSYMKMIKYCRPEIFLIQVKCQFIMKKKIRWTQMSLIEEYTVEWQYPT